MKNKNNIPSNSIKEIKEIKEKIIKIIKIIFIFIVFFLVFLLFSERGFSENSSFTPANSLKRFTCENIDDNPYKQKFDKYKIQYKSFDKSYSLLKKHYHEKMNTDFNKAITDLSRSVYLGDYEEKACAPVQYKKNNSSLFEFNSKMRAEYGLYECALESILKTDTGLSQIDQVSLFSDGISFIKNKEYQILEEIENSGKALHLSLQMYAEMRQWYPVHRDLECLISEMEKYRNALRGFIDKVSIIPAKYYNYGSKTQK